MSAGLLLVHAHPDDESIGTGATMAKYAADGVPVALVTCTQGEQGEIIPPGLRWLTPDQLAEHRTGELAAACAELGVSRHWFLGGPGRWRDSGMMGTPGNQDPRCFWRADLDQAARALAELIAEERPRAIVSYDANGFYGHPDHIQAHRVTERAYQLAADPAVTSLYATAAADAAAVTHRVIAEDFLERKRAAMRAHATQITVGGDWFALSNEIRQPLAGTECYTLLAGPGAPPGTLFR